MCGDRLARRILAVANFHWMADELPHGGDALFNLGSNLNTGSHSPGLLSAPALNHLYQFRGYIKLTLGLD
jgi:hypothetical protein